MVLTNHRGLFWLPVKERLMIPLADLAIFVAPAALTAAAAIGGVRMSLNGTRQAVIRIETKVDRIDSQTQDNRVEIAALKAGQYAE